MCIQVEYLKTALPSDTNKKFNATASVISYPAVNSPVTGSVTPILLEKVLI